jgi:hypothetical protein
VDSLGNPIKKTTVKTKAKEKTLKPNWSQPFGFDCPPEISGVEVSVWDEDRVQYFIDCLELWSAWQGRIYGKIFHSYIRV